MNSGRSSADARSFPASGLPHSEAIALEIYRLTRRFPLEERFGLAQQLRRAAVSIGSDIVEGYARSSARDFARLLDMALGSAAEVQLQLRIAHRAGNVNAADHDATSTDLQQVQRMLIRLIRRVRPASRSSRRRPRTESREPKTDNR
jgi:four helix bundle protein